MTPALRVAVIGSGPAGTYAAEGVLKQLPEAQVDVIDAGLSPFGLVRHGVAPDHLKIKSVTRVLARTLGSPRVRWFGGVRVGDRATGADLEMAELQRRYHAVVVATGAPRGRRLQVEGDHLSGSCTAADVVPWYNGHPDALPPLATRARSVVVVGAGNVALDVARVLLKGGADGLGETDLSDETLAEVRVLGAAEVHVVARRGPEDVKFGVAELRDLANLADVRLEVDPADFATAMPDDGTPVALLREWAQREAGTGERRIRFHFRRRVSRLHGTGGVESVALAAGPGAADPRPLVLSADLVVAAIGFRSEALSGLPYDEELGRIPNVAGRVVPGIYVAGWVKRGPQGVIGTNRLDAMETVAALVADAPVLAARSVDPGDIADLLARQGSSVFTWDDWLRLDAAELARGRDRGKLRAKFAGRDRMLAALVGSGSSEALTGAARPC